MIRSTATVIERMKRDGRERLVRTFMPAGPEWSLLRSGAVLSEQVVKDLSAHGLIATGDGLLPDVSQTFALRM